MKSIGTLLFLYGVAAIVFGFMDRVPIVLEWIYGWGETTAWAIKIGFVAIGAVLYFVGNKQKQAATNVDSANG